MCGFGGIFDSRLSVNQQKDILNAMGEFLKYRGPDASNQYFHDDFCSVHNRLKIVDLSDEANQPMTSQSGEFVLVFNGEIYNHQELKESYNLSGLKTTSDTEILLESFEKDSVPNVLAKCTGMFAFVLYHKPSKKLWLGRDRYGQKPLYYSKTKNNGLVFSSDIRGIKYAVPELEIDLDSVDYFLTELGMPQPKTIYKGVHQIKPGHFALFNDGKLVEHLYHEFTEKEYDETLSETEWINRIEKELLTAIEYRMMSDVDLGFFLSGGADSGLIVALLAQNTAKQIDTFTVKYDEKKFDESGYAKDVAKRYNTRHTEIHVDSKNVDQVLWDLVNEMGEPFADSSALPSYFVTKEMRKHVTVALSGDGGDELFGYPEYAFILKMQEYAKLGNTTQQFKSIMAKVKNRSKIFPVSQDAAIHFSLKNQLDGQMLRRGMGFSELEKQQLYSTNFPRNNYTDAYHKKVWHEIEGTLFSKKWIGGFRTRLLNDYLVKVDRTSMYNSLEVRSPFLDHNLADLVAKIPPRYNFKDGHAKFLLKKMAVKHLDKDFLNRPKKGFNIPITEWLKNELKDFVNEYLSVDRIRKRGLFNAEFVRRMIEDHNSGKSNHEHKIWALLWFEIWMTIHCD